MDALEEKLKGLSIAQQSCSEERTYLLDVAAHPDGLLAASSSDFTIRLHNKSTLDSVGQLKGHSGPLAGVVFSHSSPDLLYSASADGTVRCWDVRRPAIQAAQVFRSDPSHSYCSFDLSCCDTIVCAGTAQVNKEDSFIVFWDVRKQGGGLLGVYSESHSDDITQVRFHPRDKDRLASGSTDGLVNVFDLSRGTEDEALLSTCNSNSSASAICWCGADYSRLLCLSHDEGLHLWDLRQLDTDEPLTVYSTFDARSLDDVGAVDYLVGGRWLEKAQKLLVVGGKNSGEVHLMECRDKGLSLLRSLVGGHTSTVRCFLWDEAEDSVVTGGEDSQLLLWRTGGGVVTPRKMESRKSQSAVRLKCRPHKKYGDQSKKKEAPGGE
ncbi:WD repeat-containing protein 89 [Takifugu rubripes]|uniref:WD repeat-containing protein 89 n=1 Tax=Takifugu rubripes TaxID=31033 RepID=UPI00114549C0|nr:WD repeat-containing protein 89 [Takifugu rubripes]XP_029682115.1 WD repeat-containing protein 89 [Takifugu rubripes]XP_029682121.1 WD repeat-containing protein 89 [Takifugu rubripes]